MTEIAFVALARPVVVFDPAMRFGRAQIAGVPVEAIGEAAWAGESVDEIAVEYDLTRPQVVVACWFLGTHGTRRWRQRWAAWATEVASELWNSRYEVADPPTSEGIES